MFGHQVLPEAELRDMTEQAGLSPGSRSGVLSRPGDEGLISAVRTEQGERRPRPRAHRTRRTARNAGGPPPAGA
jgi:hypothetical protein